MCDSSEHPIAIRGKFVGLRPVWPDDHALMFEWWTNQDEVPLWTSQFRGITTFQQFMPMFEGWLREGVTFMLVDLAGGTRFGFVRAYNMNLVDGWAWWQGYVIPSHRARGRMGEWVPLVGRYLFEQFPIRKLCAEIFEFNQEVRRLHEKLGFQLEGRLKQHTWYRDRYWDHLFMTLSREAFGDSMQKYGFIRQVEDDLSSETETRADRTAVGA